MGLRFFPIVGWAERGDLTSDGHGNSVPRFHITWGTGPGVLEPFLRRCAAMVDAGRLQYAFRHRVDSLIVEDGRVCGVRGAVLEPTDVPRGVASSRVVSGEFEFRAGAVVVASGGIGGNLDLVRAAWPPRLGTPPASMVAGVPAHVDGRMIGIAEASGALTQQVIEKEFALSGSEQNPDLTGRSIRLLLKRVLPGAPGPVEAFKRHGPDFVVAESVEELVAGMNRLAPEHSIETDAMRTLIAAHDAEAVAEKPVDPQQVAIRRAREYVGDKLIRVATPHRFGDRPTGR